MRNEREGLSTLLAAVIAFYKTKGGKLGNDDVFLKRNNFDSTYNVVEPEYLNIQPERAVKKIIKMAKTVEQVNGIQKRKRVHGESLNLLPVC